MLIFAIPLFSPAVNDKFGIFFSWSRYRYIQGILPKAYKVVGFGFNNDILYSILLDETVSWEGQFFLRD